MRTILSIPVRNGRADGSATRLKADVGDIALIGFEAKGSLLYQHTIGTKDVWGMDLDSPAGKIHGDAVRLLDTFVGWNWTRPRRSTASPWPIFPGEPAPQADGRT